MSGEPLTHRGRIVVSKRWSDRSTRERSVIVTATAAQLSLLAAALFDLHRRPADQVNGPKRLWRAAAFINFVGPISYFLFGRKKEPPADAGSARPPHEL